MALAISDWFTVRAFKSFYHTQTARELQARAVLLRAEVAPLEFSTEQTGIDSLCKALGHASGTRVTVMLPSGVVIGDTDEDPSNMENHATRPEIQQALAGQTGTATRYSHTVHKTMMYTAVPILAGDRLIGVIRTSIPLADIDETFGSIYIKVIGGLALIALLAAAISFYIARRLTRPLVSMTLAAGRFAHGEFDHPLPAPTSRELGDLSQTMNQMAAQLDQKIRTITDQRNERDAVLTSMVEGVIAVDPEERIISVNRAASAMLGIDRTATIGHYLQEVIRVAELHRFVDTLLRTRASQDSQFELQGVESRIVQALGAPLVNERGQNMGGVVVLHDITRLHRLEQVRRDFVANVSHELRTPITSIKGFVETIRDGGADTAQTARFLDIISRQTDRLNSIINDLLTLSELEQSSRGEIGFERVRLGALIQGAIEVVHQKAEAASVTIALHGDTEIETDVNPSLMEQAIVNLLDNAIKYSNPGGLVEIKTAVRDGNITISITDHGCGIERIHLPRLFERFYRVDRARSRELGGTGLGLSIVKHIVTVHGGTVTVDSSPGIGSCFTLTFPKSTSAANA